MANINITNNDLGSVELKDGQFRDDTYAAAGADTLVEGTIMARSTASAKLIIYVKGGAADGNGVPVAVLTVDAVSTAATDYPVRPLIAGSVRKERLVIDADGDASNVDAVVMDLLRSVSIIPIDVQELNILDNQ